MFIRKYWFGLSVFLVAIAVVSLYYLQTGAPQEYIPYKPKPVEADEPSPDDIVPDPTKARGEWLGKFEKLSDEYDQTSQAWVEALPRTPEELERLKTDKNYNRAVRRNLPAVMDKDQKAYIRLQGHQKTTPLLTQ